MSSEMVSFYADGVECDTECHSPVTTTTKTYTLRSEATVIHYDDIYLIL